MVWGGGLLNRNVLGKQPRKRSCNSSRLSRVVLCHHWWGGYTDTEGRVVACNENEGLHRWNMTKHTGFQSFLIFATSWYLTWRCRDILDRSPKVPFQSISGHQQDSDSESSFGSYSEDDAEPAVPAPFGEPKKKRCCEQGGDIQTHVTFHGKRSWNLRWIGLVGIISVGFWKSVEAIAGKTS